MAWSFGARRKNLKCEHGIFNQCPKPNAKVQDCRNCLGYAIEWRSKVMRYVIWKSIANVEQKLVVIVKVVLIDAEDV